MASIDLDLDDSWNGSAFFDEQFGVSPGAYTPRVNNFEPAGVALNNTINHGASMDWQQSYIRGIESASQDSWADPQSEYLLENIPNSSPNKYTKHRPLSSNLLTWP